MYRNTHPTTVTEALVQQRILRRRLEMIKTTMYRRPIWRIYRRAATELKDNASLLEEFEKDLLKEWDDDIYCTDSEENEDDPHKVITESSECNQELKSTVLKAGFKRNVPPLKRRKRNDFNLEAKKAHKAAKSSSESSSDSWNSESGDSEDLNILSEDPPGWGGCSDFDEEELSPHSIQLVITKDSRVVKRTLNNVSRYVAQQVKDVRRPLACLIRHAATPYLINI